MPEIVIPTRAAYGYIEGKRADRYGDRKNQSVKTNIVPSKGMFSTKEMEGVMREVAADAGASEDQIRIVSYPKGEAPMEANPRHRRSEYHSIHKRPSEPTEVRPRQDYQKRVFGGFGTGTMTRYQST